MRAADASARWGCDHHAPNGCPWCENPDGEAARTWEWRRDVSDYIPMYGLPTPQVAPSSTLAEWIEKSNPGFFDRSAGVA